MNEAILAHRDGAVQVLSITNLAALNALAPELNAALAAAQADPAVGAIVLTGDGPAFCAGGYLNVLSQRRAMTPPERRVGIEGLHDLIRSIRDCSKPVIAAVEGAAAGAGLSIALVCDLLVATRAAVFSVAYVKVRLSPEGGATAFLSEYLSRQLLTELCLKGDCVTGERMHALGVVTRLTESGDVLATAIALAATLAGGPQRAIARIKALCRHVGENTLEAQLDLEAQYMTESLDDEAAEGIRAFFDKRPGGFVALRGAPATQSH